MKKISSLFIVLSLVVMACPFNALGSNVTEPSGSSGYYSLPSGRSGSDYEYRFRAEGGLAPLKWRLAAGQLPEGIELTESGILRGKPTVARREPFTFSLEVSDSSEPPQIFVQQFALSVQAAPLKMVLGAPALKIVAPDAESNNDPEANIPSVSRTGNGNQDKEAGELRVLSPYVPPLASWNRKSVTPEPDSGGASSNGTNNNEKNESLNPAKFIRIYEYPQSVSANANADRRIIYDPENLNKKTTKLSSDKDSTIVIKPVRELMGQDMALNKLFITAELISGNEKRNLEVIGYSEVGKDKEDAQSQRALAFQSTQNLIATVLTLAGIADRMLDNVYCGGEDCSFPKLMEKRKSQPVNEDILKKMEKQLQIHEPEINSVLDFLLDDNHLALVEIIGTEVFSIDRNSLRSIAQDYKDDLKALIEIKKTDGTTNTDLVDNLLERTYQVRERLDVTTAGIRRLVCSENLSSMVKEVPEEDKDVQGMITELNAIKTEKIICDEDNPDYKKTENLVRLRQAKNLATRIYAQLWARRALDKLKNQLTTGYISLSNEKASDGAMVIIRVEARNMDGREAGIPALFEVAIKQYGAKVHLTDSLMFIKRKGINGMNPQKLDAVNFAPAPGLNFGVTFFRRGQSPLDKLYRALAPSVGVNVSYLNFKDNPDEEEGGDVQLGAGPMVGLFNNKIYLTYGWNFNVPDKRQYWGIGFSFIDTAKFIKDKATGEK